MGRQSTGLSGLKGEASRPGCYWARRHSQVRFRSMNGPRPEEHTPDTGTGTRPKRRLVCGRLDASAAGAGAGAAAAATGSRSFLYTRRPEMQPSMSVRQEGNRQVEAQAREGTGTGSQGSYSYLCMHRRRRYGSVDTYSYASRPGPDALLIVTCSADLHWWEQHAAAD